MVKMQGIRMQEVKSARAAKCTVEARVQYWMCYLHSEWRAEMLPISASSTDPAYPAL
jgi:hypothetical protein